MNVNHPNAEAIEQHFNTLPHPHPTLRIDEKRSYDHATSYQIQIDASTHITNLTLFIRWSDHLGKGSASICLSPHLETTKEIKKVFYAPYWCDQLVTRLEHQSIKFSADKEPKKIAQDIARRLLNLEQLKTLAILDERINKDIYTRLSKLNFQVGHAKKLIDRYAFEDFSNLNDFTKLYKRKTYNVDHTKKNPIANPEAFADVTIEGDHGTREKKIKADSSTDETTNIVLLNTLIERLMIMTDLERLPTSDLEDLPCLIEKFLRNKRPT